MPVLSKLPAGSGSGEPGISNGQGILKLNIFTQMDEPEKKDGIWVQTNHQYERVMVNQPTVSNYQAGVWSKVSDLPFEYGNGSAVVYNGEIYTICKGNSYMYKWNGSSWVNIGNTNSVFHQYGGSIIVWNNELHMITMQYVSTGICDRKWNGSSWEEVFAVDDDTAVPARDSTVIYNGEIWFSNANDKLYSYNGYRFAIRGHFPDEGYWYSSMVSYNGAIHIMGIRRSYTYNKHYIFKNTFTMLND